MTDAATAIPNRTARRRQRTRQQLLDAAQKLVLQLGYEEASAEAIAELADLGRSTFYNHFDNKQDAVLELLTQRFRDYGEAAWVPLEEIRDRGQSMIRSTIRVFQAMAEDPLTEQLVDKPRLLALAIANSQGEFLLRDFSEGLEQGRFKLAVSIESQATILNSCYVGMLIQAIRSEAARETSLEWARFLALNLGIPRHEIEGLIELAIRE